MDRLELLELEIQSAQGDWDPADVNARTRWEMAKGLAIAAQAALRLGRLSETRELADRATAILDGD